MGVGETLLAGKCAEGTGEGDWGVVLAPEGASAGVGVSATVAKMSLTLTVSDGRPTILMFHFPLWPLLAANSYG